MDFEGIGARVWQPSTLHTGVQRARHRALSSCRNPTVSSSRITLVRQSGEWKASAAHLLPFHWKQTRFQGWISLPRGLFTKVLKTSTASLDTSTASLPRTSLSPQNIQQEFPSLQPAIAVLTFCHTPPKSPAPFVPRTTFKGLEGRPLIPT